MSFYHHDVVGAKMARKRLSALRFPGRVVDDVAALVGLHLRFHGYGSGEWTDSAVRRYVRDAGPLLERLHVLTRADCTTRNQRKALALTSVLRQPGGADRANCRSRRSSRRSARTSTATQIMKILGIAPGPLVGRAYRHLLELRLDRGPLIRLAGEESCCAGGPTNRRTAGSQRGRPRAVCGSVVGLELLRLLGRGDAHGSARRRTESARLGTSRLAYQNAVAP